MKVLKMSMFITMNRCNKTMSQNSSLNVSTSEVEKDSTLLNTTSIS